MSNLNLWQRTELKRLKQDMDALFDSLVSDFCSPIDLRLLQRAPQLQARQDSEAVLVTANLPDLDPNSLTISLTGRALTVSGEKVEEIEGAGDLSLRRQSFSSTVYLSCPVHVDRVKARYVSGILRIVLPRIKAVSAVRVVVDKANHEEGTHE